MISFKELLGDHSITDLSTEQSRNLYELLPKINVIRDAWGKPMTVTSGFRSWQDMLRIYRAKGIADDKIPKGSQHLKGNAVDISDPDGSLYTWLREDKDGILAMEKAGLYGELNTEGWVHCQSVPPISGHRWFVA